MPHLCLIINAAPSTARSLKRDLPAYGIRPYVLDLERVGKALLDQWRFDVILLDADGPGSQPMTALRTLRRSTPSRVTMLARAPSESEQLAWLEAGAGDILALPESTRLLAALLSRRIEAGRDAAEHGEDVSAGPLTMSVNTGIARVEGKELSLTMNEFELLCVLASQPGRFVRRDAIAFALNRPSLATGRGTDVHVYRIRKKLNGLGVSGIRLDTVHGRGYCLTVQPQDSLLNAGPDPIEMAPSWLP